VGGAEKGVLLCCHCNPAHWTEKKINGANRSKTLAKEIKTSSRIWKKRVSGEQRVKGL